MGCVLDRLLHADSGRGLRADESGATTLEWTLLLGAIALPSYWIFQTLLSLIFEYYRMMSTLNGLPFP